jgi:hypothetical protein
VDSLDLSHEPHPRGAVQGPIVGVGRDALNMECGGGDALQNIFFKYWNLKISSISDYNVQGNF